MEPAAPDGTTYPALVVFDCDGVLVDSERISVRVGTTVMADLGWNLTQEEFAEHFVGCSREHFLREAEAGLGRRLGPGWDEPYQHLYRSAFAAELASVPGVIEVMNDLDGAAIPYCVASNSDHAYLRRVLGATGQLDRLEGRVYSATDVSRGKPAPDLYLHAAQRMGVVPSRCVVVEDSPFGVTAAVAAGMACYAYAGGVTPEHRLQGLGATVFHEMTDLGARLTGRPASAAHVPTPRGQSCSVTA